MIWAELTRTASVISRQQRDVNLSPDPVLKITAVASWPGFSQMGSDVSNGKEGSNRPAWAERNHCRCAACGPCIQVASRPEAPKSIRQRPFSRVDLHHSEGNKLSEQSGTRTAPHYTAEET